MNQFWKKFLEQKNKNSKSGSKMDLETKLTKIVDAYQSTPPPISFMENGNGSIYVPAIFQDVVKSVIVGKKNKVFNGEGYFMDAGSGDGRVLAILDCFGYKPIGIEHDPELASHSRGVLDGLRAQGVIGKIPVIEGDFLQDRSYEKAGIKFDEVTDIFHGLNQAPYEELAKKIASESPNRTSVTVYSPFGSEVSRPENLFPIGKKMQVGVAADINYFVKSKQLH